MTIVVHISMKTGGPPLVSTTLKKKCHTNIIRIVAAVTHNRGR